MKKFILFLLPLFLVLVACKREKAVWETDWQAPLLRDTLDLNKLITEDSIISVNGGYLELNFDKTIYELKLSEFVKIPDTTIDHNYSISSLNLTVPPGTSFVNNAKEHVINMGEIQLKKVRVKSGGIAIKLMNPIGTKAEFVIELPGVTKNGITLSRSFSAPAGTNANPSEVTGFVDLAGYELDLRGENLGSFNRIQSKLLVTSDPNGPSVTITPADIMKFRFTMQDIALDYARGYFGDDITSDTIFEHLEILDKFQSGMLDLPASSLQLEIVNGLKVAGRAKITHVRNTNKQGSVVNLQHPSFGEWMTINSATGNEYSMQPTSTAITFNSGNSNVEQFLENHGADNEIGFQIQLNPWGNTSGGYDEVFPQSSIKVNFSGNMPLSIGLTDVILQDTFDFSLKQDNTKTHIESGILTLDAINAFPFSGEVTLYLMDASGNTITAIAGTSSVLSSVYGTLVNGVQQKKSHLDFVIPASALDQLADVKQLSVRLKLNTPEIVSGTSQMTQIPANAFFGFRIGATIKVEAHL